MESVGRASWASGLRRISPLAIEPRGQTIQGRLDYEVGRARRYGGRVSIIVFHEISEDMAEDTWQRFAAEMSDSLRDLDSSWVDRDRVVVVLPETDLRGRSHVVDRVLDVAEREGLAIEAAAATFPDEAVTADALIRSVTTARNVRSA